MKKIIIFGSSGLIGKSLSKLFLSKNFEVIEITKKIVNFENENSYEKISQLLNSNQPDIIINSSGYFGYNDVDFQKLFTVNLKSNWDIIRYYIQNPPYKKIKIIMLGSSSYKYPRKNYVLYAASKSALYSLFRSTSELLEKTNVILGLVNPGKILEVFETEEQKKTHLEVNEVSKKIFGFVKSIKKNKIININYPK